MRGCAASTVHRSIRRRSTRRSPASRRVSASATSRRCSASSASSSLKTRRARPCFASWPPRSPEDDVQRQIAVITTSRADYSHLYWPLRDLSAHLEVDLNMIVLGSHLSPEFGHAVQEIEPHGYPIASRIVTRCWPLPRSLWPCASPSRTSKVESGAKGRSTTPCATP